MTSSLRVLHVIRGLTNSSGTTHAVIPLAEAQADLGCKVSVLHVAKPGEPSLQPNSARVESRCFEMSLPLNNPGVSRSFARTLRRRIRDFDVVHVHAIWNFPTWWAMRTASAAGVPYIVAPQGSFDPWALAQNRWRKRVYGLLTEMPLLRKADRLQALTEKEREQFRTAGLEVPVSVIPNGVDPRVFKIPFQRLAAVLGLPAGEKTLLYLSRVHPKKGLDLLLDAFRVVRQMHQVTLVVAGGDGGSGYLDQIKAMAAQLGVAEHCRFLGELNGSRKFETLLGADAFALISRSEGLPVAALEAFCAGLPSVLSTECNLPEVAAHDAGWLVPPDAEAAAAALSALLAMPSLAAHRARRARDLVESRFTWTRIALDSLAAYASMISARHAPV